ncbi:MAG: host attachment protein [Polyangia bacterium]|jgi:protein required for attachment to host cells
MQPHLPVWVLVADSSRARIFEVKIGSDAFELVSEFPHAGGHKHHHDGAADAHNHAAHTQFARELCHALSQGLNSHRCGRIVIAANPEFLGHLRDVADHNLQKHISEAVHKDYTTLNPRELAERLRDHLA